ncbi:hypothetical protein PARPLA_03155 [Rhodobacteraceae bacterium THAF1]|nr:hypothetical protein FIU81_07730 [Palleronia sp. THAF1]VDC30613.1 hypothetical protein PARPLA_03155 [Rhodobacteraceae bacterium THAF1]
MRDRVSSYNERVKLFAGFLNAIGVGLIGFSLLRPLVETGSVAVLSPIWALLGVVFHGAAHYVLGYLKKEPSDG